jgi:hypothetical protein
MENIRLWLVYFICLVSLGFFIHFVEEEDFWEGIGDLVDMKEICIFFEEGKDLNQDYCYWC